MIQLISMILTQEVFSLFEEKLIVTMSNFNLLLNETESLRTDPIFTDLLKMLNLGPLELQIAPYLQKILKSVKFMIPLQGYVGRAALTCWRVFSWLVT